VTARASASQRTALLAVLSSYLEANQHDRNPNEPGP
jgi:hypothetical protein